MQQLSCTHRKVACISYAFAAAQMQQHHYNEVSRSRYALSFVVDNESNWWLSKRRRWFDIHVEQNIVPILKASLDNVNKCNDVSEISSNVPGIT